nr:reverse transcriptase domain-containing protein [Tanacetum cinerariifolium]
MKNYVVQLERLGYVLPRDLSVGLIMNGLTSDFVGFVRNYNKHNMGKTIGELHALLIKYEKSLPKKAATPHVMAIQGGRIHKANKESLNVKGKVKRKGKGKDKSYIPRPKNPKPSTKEHLTKDDTCHHCKEVGHCKRNYPAYLVELIKKKKQVGTATVDYLSKWVEAKALPTNDARVVVMFLKSLFSRFGTPKAVISDRGTHFCNDKFSRVMANYRVTHRLSTAYHPQTSGKVEVTNRGLKRILERTKLQLNELSELRDQAYENSLIYKEPGVQALLG